MAMNIVRTKQTLRRVLLGNPLEESRMRLKRRTKKMDEDYRARQPVALMVAAWAAFVLLGFMVVVTVMQLAADLVNPGWWMMFWFFGGLMFLVGGYPMRYIPRGSRALTNILLAWALGLLALPWTMSAALAFNFIAAAVALVFLVPALIFLNHACRYFELHREGFMV
jgi:hypothetical protein